MDMAVVQKKIVISSREISEKMSCCMTKAREDISKLVNVVYIME